MQDRERLFESSVKVVLMRTTHPGNIGAVARAMKNMGLKRLCLVQPKEFPCFDASRRASGAVDILEHAEVVETIDCAIGDAHLVIGASARNRKMTWPVMNPRDCASLVSEKVFDNKSLTPVEVVLLFGQEASGLSNDELQRCHYHVNVPANPEFSSLNLAMAVQVICYELRMSLLLDNSRYDPHECSKAYKGKVLSPLNEGWDEELATVSDVESFFDHLETTLLNLEFYDLNNPGMLITRLRRLFQRTHLDKMEINILRGILSAVQKKLDIEKNR